METTFELVETLCSKDNQEAYRALKILEARAEQSDEEYAFFERFAQMLLSEDSYIRNRGLALIADNAKWDYENKLEGVLAEYLAHIGDEKPITARQCIKKLPIIAKYKPKLAPPIKEALENADTSRYADSMRPLIIKDIARALIDINACCSEEV